MTYPGDTAPPEASIGKPIAVFVMGSAAVGSVSQVSVYAESASTNFQAVSAKSSQVAGHLEVRDKIERAGPELGHKLAEKEALPMTTNAGWSAFLKSPHFTVVSTGVVVLMAGLGMYVMLDGKISSLRLETKSDLQLAAQRVDDQFTKVDSRFDRVDGKFDTLLNKIDSDSKELRAMLQAAKP